MRAAHHILYNSHRTRRCTNDGVWRIDAGEPKPGRPMLMLTTNPEHAGKESIRRGIQQSAPPNTDQLLLRISEHFIVRQSPLA
jgi:hypothetical protein